MWLIFDSQLFGISIHDKIMFDHLKLQEVGKWMSHTKLLTQPNPHENRWLLTSTFQGIFLQLFISSPLEHTVVMSHPIGSKTMCRLLRYLTIFVCTLAFLYTSSKIYSKYHSGRTIVSNFNSPVKPQDQIKSPIIIICAKKPYKDNYKVMPTLEDYLENTYDIRHDVIFDFNMRASDNSFVRIVIISYNVLS